MEPVFVSFHPVQADLMRSALEAAGFETILTGEHLVLTCEGDDPFPVKVLVRSEDAAKAREFVALLLAGGETGRA